MNIQDLANKFQGLQHRNDRTKSSKYSYTRYTRQAELRDVSDELVSNLISESKAIRGE